MLIKLAFFFFFRALELENRVLYGFVCVFQFSFTVGIITLILLSFLINIIHEVDCSLQLLEPNWSHHQGIPRRRKHLCNFCVLSFHDSCDPLQMKRGRALGSDSWVTRTVQLQHLDPEARADEAGLPARVECIFPVLGSLCFFQQTTWSAPEGFKLGNVELQGILEMREQEISLLWRIITYVTERGDLTPGNWFLVIVLRK